MGVNKLIMNGVSRFDLTEDTANENSFLTGYTAHNAAGDPIEGNLRVIEIPDTVTAHNNFIRSKVLVSPLPGDNAPYTLEELAAMVSARDYSDIFAGDIIKVNMPAIAAISNYYNGYSGGVTGFLVAEIESHRNFGDVIYGASGAPANMVDNRAEPQKGHLCLIPIGVLGNSKMKTSDSTYGAYNGTLVKANVIPAIVTALENQNAFGNHVLTSNEPISTFVETSAVSASGANQKGSVQGYEWQNLKARLMSNIEAFGNDSYSSSGCDSCCGLPYQLSVFRIAPKNISIRFSWWTSDISNNAEICSINGRGMLYAGSATYTMYIRPRFLFG